ncbi:MAG: YdcF family protein [Patescibacteria group bacterium]|nr:YdcF family protein [Patescibacteria group bacterium]
MRWQTLLRYAMEAAIVVVVLILFVVVGYIDYETRPYIFNSITDVPTTQTALVLGASVTSTGALSPVLKERADEAVALYRAQKVSKILVTGDDAAVSYNEVDPVGRYLNAQGIPERDIFLDHAGFDTYSSMYRARDVFGVSSVIIVSQPFHLPRAVFIARELGLNAYGAAAGQGELFLFNDVREIPASIKAVYDLAALRVPKYLGEKYPIGGDGSATWIGTSTALRVN